MKKVVKSEIELGLPFLGPDLVCKFQMICLKETKIIDRKSNAGHMGGSKCRREGRHAPSTDAENSPCHRI
jgi:hypothetical protein